MRRIGITAFVAVYTILILSITVARTGAWANQESETLSHSGGDEGSPRITHPDKSDPPPSQKKWIESGFAVESPEEAAIGPTPSSSLAFLSTPEYRSTPGGPGVSPRAPPSHS